MSFKTQALRDLVVERLVVAADEIFALYEQTFAEYEQVLRSQLLQDHKYHIQQESRDELQQAADVQSLVVQTEVDPNLKYIKYEEEEIPLDLQFPLTVKSEGNVNKSTFCIQKSAEEHTIGEEYEEEEPSCSFGLNEEFAPCSYSDTDNSEDWEPSPKKKRKSRKRKNGLNGKTKMKENNECAGNDVSIEREQLLVNIHNPQTFIGAKVKAFRCTVCNNNFTERHYLNEHMRVHTGEKPFRCEPCGLSFTFRQNYHQHNLAVHRKEKPHRCRVCNKDFADKRELIAHRDTHKDEKPFKCLNCNKTFAFIKNLMSHKMSERCL